MPVSINQGTQTSIQTDAVGTNQYQIVKLDVGAAGASSLFTSTLGTVQNLNAGTITAVTTVTNLNNGTVQNLGTLTAGTVDTIGLINANYFGTTVTSGTSTLGTIKATVGAGTRIYITDMIISVNAASNIVIADGGTATPIIGTLSLAANGGLTSNLRSPLRTSQGGTLVFQQSANTALSITITGYTAP